MKIYTKTGDKGETSLFDGTRVKKDSLRVDSYGEVDELNSAIGTAITFLQTVEIKEILSEIQKDLFKIGGILANPSFDKTADDKIKLDSKRVEFLEKAIDGYAAQLPEIEHFILPGGSKGASLLHFTRCVCRRAERKTVQLAIMEAVPEEVVKYMNRLSDLLFTMARYENYKEGVDEIFW